MDKISKGLGYYIGNLNWACAEIEIFLSIKHISIESKCAAALSLKTKENGGNRQTFGIASTISECAHTKSAVFQHVINK